MPYKSIEKRLAYLKSYGKLYYKIYYKKNKIKILLKAKRYRENNHDKVMLNLKLWRRKNSDKYHEQLKRKEYKRRSLLFGNGFHNEKQWVELKRKFGFRCAICKKRKSLTRDHITPVSKGGSNCIDNIQPLCRSCNSRKGTKIIGKVA